MICPYFTQMERMIEADIIFVPYNYIINSTLRKNIDLKLKNSILIFDEAHNIINSAEDQISLKLDVATIDKCREELELAINTIKEFNNDIPSIRA